MLYRKRVYIREMTKICFFSEILTRFGALHDKMAVVEKRWKQPAVASGQRERISKNQDIIKDYSSSVTLYLKKIINWKGCLIFYSYICRQ